MIAAFFVEQTDGGLPISSIFYIIVIVAALCVAAYASYAEWKVNHPTNGGKKRPPKGKSGAEPSAQNPNPDRKKNGNGWVDPITEPNDGSDPWAAPHTQVNSPKHPAPAYDDDDDPWGATHTQINPPR